MTDAPAVQIVKLSSSAQLSHVAEDVFDSAIDAQALADYLSDPNAFTFIAVDDGMVVGQIRGTIQRQPDGPPQWFIDNLGVSPTHQRCGIGRRLFAAMTEEAKKRGATEVYVFTEPDNARANAFYLALGLVRHETVMFDTAL